MAGSNSVNQVVTGFADLIIQWQKQHGRHDLPWQNTRDPYAIWVSEIMLQQTQVTAVIGYYQRFMQRFPDIASLVEGWPGLPKVEKQLWQLAESLMPQTEVVAYTQGLMDLGATLCTRSKPRCGECPLHASCGALVQDKVKQLPAAKPRKALPEKSVTMLLLLQGDEILLEKRPPSGIWGGLWSLPEVETGIDVQVSASERYGLETEQLPSLPVLSHAFTHFRLHITPQPLRIIGNLPRLQQSSSVMLSRKDAIGAALPTPIRKILRELGSA